MMDKTLRSFFAATGVALLAATAAEAQIYTELGDAGQSSSSPQFSGLVDGGPLSTILGTLASPTDADLYVIRITNSATFSASTVNGATSLDTALFLFNGNGNAIFTNDDASGMSLQSTLSAGSSFSMLLTPGVYFLGISLSGNDPINSVNQLLFVAMNGGDTLGLRGAAEGINPQNVNDFNGGTFFAESGAYRIDLTGVAAVPEPSTTALCVAGIGALGLAIRRRRRAAQLNSVMLS